MSVSRQESHSLLWACVGFTLLVFVECIGWFASVITLQSAPRWVWKGKKKKQWNCFLVLQCVLKDTWEKWSLLLQKDPWRRPNHTFTFHREGVKGLEGLSDVLKVIYQIRECIRYMNSISPNLKVQGFPLVYAYFPIKVRAVFNSYIRLNYPYKQALFFPWVDGGW